MAVSANAERAMQKVERIARIAGRTTYKSFREGFGGRLCEDADLDIKLALAQAQRRTTQLAVRALETRYASTLQHETFLRREFAAHLVENVLSREEARDKHLMTVHRFGCALGIRQFAGQRYIQTAVADYAWMLVCRRNALEGAIMLTESWLSEHSDRAENEFSDALRERRSERKQAYA